MTNPMITEHNVSTGEIVVREMTPEEIDPTLTWSDEEKAKALAIQETEAAKAAIKASAQAKLAALGLTQEEIAALSK
jgi:hypothetical protein